MRNVNPFDLANEAQWQRWREQKLEQAPRSLDELIVEVDDPRSISEREHEALLQRIRRSNMALYASTLDQEGTDIPRAIGARFGCTQLDHNRGAEADAVTALTVQKDPLHAPYIPYTNREIHWHTDGYYNRLEQQDHALLLHCVRPALHGGENGLMDHEMAYLLMREQHPEYVEALMQPDAMVIPRHLVEGEELRPERGGPVFMVRADGKLHMRYTMRKRNVVWSEAPLVQQAVAWLRALLNSDSPHIFHATLQPGWGLICNNVLHDRSAFEDGDNPAENRLLYRARYHDRIHCT
jgi:hypothetical protein